MSLRVGECDSGTVFALLHREPETGRSIRVVEGEPRAVLVGHFPAGTHYAIRPGEEEFTGGKPLLEGRDPARPAREYGENARERSDDDRDDCQDLQAAGSPLESLQAV